MKLTFHTTDQGILEFEVLKSSVLVGRGSSCDVVIKTEGISRQHCRIDVTPKGEILITDLASTNGVHIDEERLPINMAIPYSTYLTLSIGSIPRVVIDPGQAIIKEERVVLNSNNTPDINITLDLPKDKTRKISRRGLNSKPGDRDVSTTSDVPKPLIFAGVAFVLALTYYFMTS
jgi:FHA domain